MPDVESASSTKPKPKPHYGTPLPSQAVPQIPVIALGMSLGLFLAVTFSLCVGFDLLFPDRAMYKSWLRLLPGFTWLSWSSFLLGLAESFSYGWYVALVFGPLYNFFATRLFAKRLNRHSGA